MTNFLQDKMAKRLTPMSDSFCYTEAEVRKLSFTWTIKNYSYCCENTGIYLESCNFPAGGNDKPKWGLRAYPKGSSKESEGYLSVYIYLISFNGKEGVRAKPWFSILNSKRKQEFQSCVDMQSFVVNGSGWGIPNFVRQDLLLEKSKHYLPDDTLTLYCEVAEVLDTVRTSNGNNAMEYEVPECHLSEDLGLLFENQESCDVILSANGTDIGAHKNILESRSSVFKAMFGHDMEENRQSRVEIADIEHEVLREMLRFMYTGKAPNIGKMANKLLVAADKYDLERLKRMCAQVLCSNLTVDTAADILITADMCRADPLKAHSIDFIKTNETDVKATTGWKEMINRHPLLIAEIYGALVSQEEPPKKRTKLT